MTETLYACRRRGHPDERQDAVHERSPEPGTRRIAARRPPAAAFMDEARSPPSHTGLAVHSMPRDAVVVSRSAHMAMRRLRSA